MTSEMHEAGHLTALGWTTLALYLLAAGVSFRAAMISRSRHPAAMGRVWVWLGAILALLGLNKLLNAQTLLIELGRHIAGTENLSGYRRELQALFFLGFVAGLIVLLGVLLLRGRAQVAVFCRQFRLATVGCILVGAYLVLRAASIESVDRMLGWNLERIPFLWLLEAGGLTLIIVQGLANTGSKSKG